MRLRDDKKRAQIIAAAARLFAAQPFHKVRLEDVAAAAAVGKGTLYIYFKSKEDLFHCLLYDRFAELVRDLQSQLAPAGGSARDRLARLVRAMVEFTIANPGLLELARSGISLTARSRADWERQSRELFAVIERSIRMGIESGEFRDKRPRLTALFIPGMIRSVMLYGPRNHDKEALIDQVMTLLERGIGLEK